MLPRTCLVSKMTLCSTVVMKIHVFDKCYSTLLDSAFLTITISAAHIALNRLFVHCNVITLGLKSLSLKPRSHCPGVRPGRTGTEFECVHIFPAVLRTRPGLGQKIDHACPGNATVCDGAFPL